MQMVKLNQLCEINIGKTPSRGKMTYWGSGGKWISIADLKEKYIIETKEEITELAINECNMKLIPKNTVIMSFKLTIGKVAITGDDFYSNEAIANFPILDSTRLIPEYLYYALQTINFTGTTDRAVMGATLNKAKLNELMIPIVDIHLQHKIVQVLDKAQRLIDKRKEQIEACDELIKSQFIEMFGMPHEMRFTTKTLPQIITEDKNALKRGPFGGSLKKDDFVDKGYLVYEQRHAIHNDFEYEKYYITEEKYREMEMFKVVPDDLLISCSGVTLGRIAEVPVGAKEGIINQALLKVTLNQDIMQNTFFMTLFRNEEIQDILFGFSRGSGIPNFPSMNEVKAVNFLCPPIELQNEFASFVQQVDKLKFEMEQSLVELENNFNSLMQKAFKGELF